PVVSPSPIHHVLPAVLVSHDLITISLFFFNATATTDTYTLSLHDALPILGLQEVHRGTRHSRLEDQAEALGRLTGMAVQFGPSLDRKSTRLNSSHRTISYAVFCLKKKTRSRLPYVRLQFERPAPPPSGRTF